MFADTAVPHRHTMQRKSRNNTASHNTRKQQTLQTELLLPHLHRVIRHARSPSSGVLAMPHECTTHHIKPTEALIPWCRVQNASKHYAAAGRPLRLSPTLHQRAARLKSQPRRCTRRARGSLAAQPALLASDCCWHDSGIDEASPSVTLLARLRLCRRGGCRGLALGWQVRHVGFGNLKCPPHEVLAVILANGL